MKERSLLRKLTKPKVVGSKHNFVVKTGTLNLSEQKMTKYCTDDVLSEQYSMPLSYKSDDRS